MPETALKQGRSVESGVSSRLAGIIVHQASVGENLPLAGGEIPEIKVEGVRSAGGGDYLCVNLLGPERIASRIPGTNT